MTTISFVPATSFSLDAFAAIFTRSFEGYFYPGTTTAQLLAARIRAEQIDLMRSLVMLVDGQPAGMAVLALRGDRIWCGGFGVVAEHRGAGLAHRLFEAMLDQARDAGAREFVLEVLTRNTKALNTYLAGGMTIQRDLHIFEWKKDDDAAPTAIPTGVFEADPALLLRHFYRLHPVAAAWQRDLVALLVRSRIHGLAVGTIDAPNGYVVFGVHDGGARIVDLGATGADVAALLLQTLQQRYQQVASVNEPADSPLTLAFTQCGFRETDRQHELVLQL